MWLNERLSTIAARSARNKTSDTGERGRTTYQNETAAMRATSAAQAGKPNWPVGML